MNKGYLLAFFQENPTQKANIKAILSCEDDDKIFVQTINGKKPYKGNLLFTSENLPIVAKGNQYLKLLSFTATLSQITFIYTENFDMVAEYLALLNE